MTDINATASFCAYKTDVYVSNRTTTHNEMNQKAIKNLKTPLEAK